VSACCHGAWVECREDFLAGTGLRCETVFVGEGAFILFAYHPGQLARALTEPMAAGILRERGYFIPECAQGQEAEARRLSLRLLESHLIPTLTGRYATYSAGINAEFPHEIGLFLGYPPEDVAAFIANDGKNYACRTHWKVYHEPETARRICDRIDRTKSEEADKLISTYLERKAQS
jgi:hypothetical protein